MSLQLPEPIESAIDNERKRTGAPGTWWTAAERVAIARQARRAKSGDTAGEEPLSIVANEAAAMIAANAHHIDQRWIRNCHDRGLEPLPMVELLAVVAKIVAIDTCLRGVGREPVDLPPPAAGEPSRETVEGADINRGWLPTTGPASAPVCLSAVAAEHQAWEELHSAFYLSIEEMRDLDIDKGLHRSQIELLAARTSYYNDCFY